MADTHQPADGDVPTVSTHRTFLADEASTDISTTKHSTSSTITTAYSPSSFLTYLRPHIIGHHTTLHTPFGHRTMLYCDWTSSGRAVDFIEDYIRTEILPIYSNTHTSTNYTSIQTQLLRNEARQIISQACHCSKDDIVLFCGSGSTAAINLFVHIQNIKQLSTHYTETLATHHATTDTHTAVPSHIEQLRPVVFAGPYEHHSNVLPWREAGCLVVDLLEASDGGIDLQHLTTTLQQYSANTHKYAAVSVCSNVTGIMTDTLELQRMFNEHNIICVFDYATAAPYIDVDMNPSAPAHTTTTTAAATAYKKQCVVISTHKMLGGVQTPGIMVVKKSLLQNTTPLISGGGTVFYVTADSHRYLENYYELYEGGTQSIVECIRAGTVFQLKQQITSQYIQTVEQQYLQLALDRLTKLPNLMLLGNTSVSNTHRIPILSFLIYQPEMNQLLHSNYISVLLNDLFGIQSRAGCVCSGPYAHTLLGIDTATARKFEQCLLHKQEVMRPGFVRLNLHYTHSVEQVDYILTALEWLSQHAYKLLPLYVFNVETGEWRHRQYQSKYIARRWLSNISYNTNKMQYPINHHVTDTVDYNTYLTDADTAVQAAVLSYSTMQLPDQASQLNTDSQQLRWFVLPVEALQFIKHNSVQHTPAAYSIKPPSHQHLFVLPAVKAVDSVGVTDDSKAMEQHTIGAAEHKRKNGTAAHTSDTSKKAKHSTSPSSAPVLCRNCFHTHMPAAQSLTDIKPTAECLTCQCISYTPSNSTLNTKQLAAKTLKAIQSLTGKAIGEFGMIKAGDRILIGVSGGKDSLTLVDTLLSLQRKSPVKFEIGCCTVDPQTPEYDPRSLIPYFKSRNIPYHYEAHAILDLAKSHMSSKRVSICSFCSRMKRGILYSTCRRENYNVLALGQHCDDLCESLFMSLFHNGKLRTMKANYHVERGDIRIIRPFVYVRERMTRDYAAYAQLPVIHESCPACFEDPKERQRIKLLLAKQETLFPNVYSSLQKAMMPLVRAENVHYKQQGGGGDEDGALCQLGDCALAADEDEMTIDLDKLKSVKTSSTE